MIFRIISLCQGCPESKVVLKVALIQFIGTGFFILNSERGPLPSLTSFMVGWKLLSEGSRANTHLIQTLDVLRKRCLFLLRVSLIMR